MAVLTIRGVRSYGADKDVRIDLSNKVTLIYGQNGSGKSTISNYFSGYYPEKYLQCHFESQVELFPLVFNQDYIERKFSLENVQPGIFTLSEHNKDIQEKVDDNRKKITRLDTKISELNTEIAGRAKMELTLINNCAVRMFKRTSTERSRFSSFLTGAKQQRNFYDRIKDIPLEVTELNMEELSARLKNLEKSKGTSLPYISFTLPPPLNPAVPQLIHSPLQPASGTQFAGFIANLGNADWVREGTRYIRDDVCPFCQNTFDTAHFAEEMARMYDKSYTDAINVIKKAAGDVAENIDYLNDLSERLFRHPAVNEGAEVFVSLKLLIQISQSHHQTIVNKLQRPSEIYDVADISEASNSLISSIEKINNTVSANNQLADNYDAEMARLKADVDMYLRQICDEYLVALTAELQEVRAQKTKAEQQASALLTERRQLGDQTSRLVGQLSVIQPTIDSININLKALGVTDFHICCHNEEMKLYRLRRVSDPGEQDVFRTLSEGEKTIIALLYFIESCTGSVTPDAVHDGRKIIVIDDPISSLSHNYIYEVASLIKRKIIKPETARHLVILTHNLFFFQEILLTAVRRLESKLDAPKGWSLLRIIKNEHSDCIPLSMHEMLNEYQALWQTLKDVRDNKSQVIVLPNTMRNILEYYFSFACKEEKLEKTLAALASEHAEGRYDSFYRAINRHSHSDGRNILSTGIMDKSEYFRLFRKIFEEMDELTHYCSMMDEKLDEVI
ncbi:AAA family ATPase [Escherichia coli]|uniref:AAA family ATPase n=1 Tax=Escherichia coli TaxID=562 RepID=UPI002A13CD14|nr:AAA family ATPase [Escherichia coli]